MAEEEKKAKLSYFQIVSIVVIVVLLIVISVQIGTMVGMKRKIDDLNRKNNELENASISICVKDQSLFQIKNFQDLPDQIVVDKA